MTTVPSPVKSKKLPPVAVRLDEDVRVALDKMVVEETRSLSFLLNRAARFYIEQHGPKTPRKP